VLSSVFYLASAHVFLAGRTSPDGTPARLSPARYVASLLLFQAALFSKTVTATLPAALLLVLWWKRGRVERRDVIALLPFFALGIGFGLLTAWLERHVVGALGAEWDYSLVERCLIAGRVVWFYLGKLAWPHPLIFVYPRWEIDAGGAVQYLYPLTALAALILLWAWRRRLGRGALTALLFFGGTLLPALGFFDVYPMRYSFVADHFQYLASIGPIGLAAAAGTLLARRSGSWGVMVASMVLLLLLGGLGTLTAQRIPVYQGLETLWRDTVERNPGAFMAHFNLANLLRKRGDIEESVHHYRLALGARHDLALIHNNLAGALWKLKRNEEAIGHYRRAVELDPSYGVAHFNLAAMLQERGDLGGAIHHYREAVRLEPASARWRSALARSLTAAGRPDEARLHYAEALRLKQAADQGAKPAR
jgi:tetratricopeptide (TPR) repeat protein